MSKHFIKILSNLYNYMGVGSGEAGEGRAPFLDFRTWYW